MRINYDRLVHYIYHHHVLIIIAATMLSIFAGYFASQLARNIKTDFASLLPNDYKSVNELNRIKERVGGIGPLMVLITGDDLDEAVNFMQALADSLKSAFDQFVKYLRQQKGNPKEKQTSVYENRRPCGYPGSFKPIHRNRKAETVTLILCFLMMKRKFP